MMGDLRVRLEDEETATTRRIAELDLELHNVERRVMEVENTLQWAKMLAAMIGTLIVASALVAVGWRLGSMVP